MTVVFCTLVADFLRYIYCVLMLKMFYKGLMLEFLFYMQIPHLRPAEYKRSRLSRNRRTVNRPYGGVLSGSAVRERYSLGNDILLKGRVYLISRRNCGILLLYLYIFI